jgi:hypothetical protein
MIIFGSRSTARIVAMLFFACAVCHQTVAQRLVRRRTWFTLFFAPIFPFGHGSYSVSCANCGNAYGISRENAERFQHDADEAQLNAEADRIIAAEDARIAQEQNGQYGQQERP